MCSMILCAFNEGFFQVAQVVELLLEIFLAPLVTITLTGDGLGLNLKVSVLGSLTDGSHIPHGYLSHLSEDI